MLHTIAEIIVQQTWMYHYSVSTTINVLPQDLTLVKPSGIRVQILMAKYSFLQKHTHVYVLMHRHTLITNSIFQATQGNMLEWNLFSRSLLLKLWSLTSSVGITWQSIRNAKSQALLEIYWVIICILTKSPGSVCTLRFKKHWSTPDHHNCPLQSFS